MPAGFRDISFLAIAGWFLENKVKMTGYGTVARLAAGNSAFTIGRRLPLPAAQSRYRRPFGHCDACQMASEPVIITFLKFPEIA